MSNQITAPVTIASNVITAPITAQGQQVDASINTGGRDAYQLAVAEGFVGTRAEWLASLQGVPGAPGVAGTGKEWVDITVADFAALTPEQKEDPTKVYNLIDFVW